MTSYYEAHTKRCMLFLDDLVGALVSSRAAKLARLYDTARHSATLSEASASTTAGRYLESRGEKPAEPLV